MHIEQIRKAYATRVCDAAAATLPGLVDAFATVPRERFLGPGPWLVVEPSTKGEREGKGEGGYRRTPDASPEHVYQDALVAIDPDRQLNNGHPSSHAMWIDAAAPTPEDRVLHVGCGTGYYSAIFAELVGGVGQVLAVDVDAGLAARARACLASWPQVRVEAGDGSKPDGPHDVIYVNAGATHARPEWLAALAEGGRLILPLTVHPSKRSTLHSIGITILAERHGTRWPTRVVSSVAIFDCEGARAHRAEAQLRKLLDDGATDQIGTLDIEPHEQRESCLLHMDGFCLQG
jgi:protein-L-isoaspartate(D-aspartate) O-methyltransferase